MEEGHKKSEKQAVVAKKLARSGSKNTGARSWPTPVRVHGHGRRWSWSTDLEMETAVAAVMPTPTTDSAATAVLGRSYSTAAAVTPAVDGGAKQQSAQEGEGDVEQRPSRHCGAGGRLSRKIKEHRARFYIVRRCVAMLVCWRDPDE